jgi:hypothetical protein
MLLTGLLDALGAFMIFAALAREDASVVVPLTSMSPGVKRERTPHRLMELGILTARQRYITESSCG